MTTTTKTQSALIGQPHTEDWTECLLKWKPLVELVQRKVKPYKLVTPEYIGNKAHFDMATKHGMRRTLYETEVIMVFYRFWYMGEIFHTQHGLVTTKNPYFIDWCWLVLDKYRYFSPNSHDLYPYPNNTPVVDIYIERLYSED